MANQLSNLDFDRDSAETLLSALMHHAPEDDVWHSRYNHMLQTVLPALVDLRDANNIALSKETLAQWMTLHNVESLASNHKVSNEHRSRLEQYLARLPDFALRTQTPEAEMYHGFLAMQLSRKISPV